MQKLLSSVKSTDSITASNMLIKNGLITLRDLFSFSASRLPSRETIFGNSILKVGSNVGHLTHVNLSGIHSV